MKYEKISGFTDEMTSGLEQQLRQAKMAGLSYLAVRNIDGRNICSYTPKEVEKVVLPLLGKYEMKVSSIGSPLGKIPVEDKPEFERQMIQAENAAHMAEILGCSYVRIFSFYIPDGDRHSKWSECAADKVGRLTEVFGKHGITALHENEKEIYGDTKEHCLELFEKVNSPFLKAAFDFANFVQCKEEPLKAYEVLKPYVAYFHIKDALSENGSTVVCGHGDGCIETILDRAFGDGYDGFLTLEPHLTRFEGLEQLERRAVQEMIRENMAENGTEAFSMQYHALNRILERIGSRKKGGE